MKVLSIPEQPTKEAVRVFAEKRGLTEHLPEQYQHPQEDYLLTSSSPDVFVVADGVTLNVEKLIEDNKNYPDPSPAGDVARIFCEAVVKEGGNTNTKEVFEKANEEVRRYNENVGQSKYAGNPTGYYSATGAFAIVKDGKTYWATVCDAFVAHFDKNMNQKHMSSGSCRPYAVINGEKRMAEHLEQGMFDIEKDDRLFVLTDGFAHYVRNKDFLDIFKKWDESLGDRIDVFSKRVNLEDPEKYGHERSLIATCFD